MAADVGQQAGATCDAAPATQRKRPVVSWRRFLLRAGLALSLTLATGAYLATRFRLGYDDQAHQCLPPHRWFLIDRHDRTLRRGSLNAFAALGSQMRPWFRDGQVIVKRAVGVPGDRVVVDLDSVQINGVEVGKGLALARTLKRPPSDFMRADVLPPSHLWLMGATADSFDSRYWGILPAARVIGRAYVLW
jgi:conjugal transfer pilin signal peptidase TrbI